jgi:hypothetical protein
MQSVAACCSVQRVQLRSAQPVALRLRAASGVRAAALRPQRAHRFAVLASADADSNALPAAVAVVAPVVRLPWLCHPCASLLRQPSTRRLCRCCAVKPALRHRR